MKHLSEMVGAFIMQGSKEMYRFDIKEISKDAALEMIQKYHYGEETGRCGYTWMGHKTTTYHTENISESGYKRLSGDWANVYDGRDATK